MKLLTALILLNFLVVDVSAQQAGDSDSEHQISSALKPTVLKSVESLSLAESDFNFGKIPQGKPVTHVFVVRNAGKDSLRILSVQASCGCTTPEWEQNKVLKPGESMNITVGYNAAAEGVFAKPITITYNQNKTRELMIRGEVWQTPSTSAPENNLLTTLKN